VNQVIGQSLAVRAAIRAYYYSSRRGSTIIHLHPELSGQGRSSHSSYVSRQLDMAPTQLQTTMIR
jgi:hypothetical protein